jgi:alpha-tubulin suppressor-like RCC1 family protein
LTGIVSLALGVDTTCALLNTAQVRCWGDDGYAQNGDGTIESPDFRKVPNLVRNPGNTGTLANVRQLAGKSYHFCVVLNNGQPRCWGYNSDYALGNNTTDDSPLPTGVRG